MDMPYWKETAGAIAAIVAVASTVWHWKDRQRKAVQAEKDELEKRLDEGSEVMSQLLSRVTALETEVRRLPNEAEIARLQATMDGITAGQEKLQKDVSMLIQAALRENGRGE